MADRGDETATPGVEDLDREQRLRHEYHSQTARTRWHDLQPVYARGSVIAVADDLDLVEVAVQLGLDNTARFEAWIGAGSVAAVSDEQALAWYQSNQALWAVVAPPWVLVQVHTDPPGDAVP